MAAAMGTVETFQVSMRRNQNATQWGFKMQGGSDQGLPLYIQKVNGRSIAYKRGLVAGDVILAICQTPAANMSHNQAKMEILRAGNELDFTIQRGSIDVSHPAFGIQQTGAPAKSEVVEGTQFFTSHQPFRHVQSRSFQMLSQQLADSEGGGDTPSAVTDKKFDERSPYLQAHESTIQKSYGEK